MIEAELGSELIKQRLAREGGGKSRGFRIIVYYRRGERAVFLHLFAKNERGTLTPQELETFRDFARSLQALTEEQVSSLAGRREWRLLNDDPPDKDVPQ